MTPTEPRGLIARVIQNKNCRKGDIASLKPKAFMPPDGKHGISFYGCDRMPTAAEILDDYNHNKDIPEDDYRHGGWIVRLSVDDIKAIDGVKTVEYDQPAKPAHVMVGLDPKLDDTGKEKVAVKLLYLATQSGLRSLSDEA